MNDIELKTKLIRIEVIPKEYENEPIKNIQATSNILSQMISWMLMGGFISIPVNNNHRRIITFDIDKNFAEAALCYQGNKEYTSGEYQFYIANWVNVKLLLDIASRITEESKDRLLSNIALTEIRREGII